MIIRKGKISDLKEVSHIIRTTPEFQGSENSSIYSKSFLEDTFKDKKMNVVFMAEENGKIVGFLVAETWRKKGYSFLTELYVYPEFRKKGIAGALVKELEKYCKKNKMGKIVALVLKSNKRMQKFQKKLGYGKGNLVYYYEKELK